MAQMNISNTLFNDTQTGIIAYVEQLKDRLLKNYIATLSQKDQGRIPADIKAQTGVFQERLNEFFVKHWVDFQSFLLDEGVDPTVIDSWYEVQEFLKGLPDDEAMWLKNKLTQLDNRITAMDIPDGGAYDVSADHVDGGGNYAVYVDLSAALDAVPSEKQKPGMSIRFIQGNSVDSSDNKYIQARCMAQNFTTDVTQWQGVDEELTAGSNNIAKSGEVAKGIFDYAMMLCKNFDFSGGDAIPFITENSARISENGVKINGSGYDIAKFAIDGRKIYKINFPSGSDYCSPMAFVDDNNQVIDYISAGAVSATTRVVAFPNCKGNIWISAAHSRFSGVSVTAVDINDNLILNFQDNSIDLSKLKNDAIQSYPTAQVIKLQTSDGVTKYVGRIALNIGNIITTQEQDTITIDALTNLGVNSGDILYIKLSWTGNVERIRVRDEYGSYLKTSVVSGTEYMLTIASAFNTLRLEFKNANITDVVLSVDTKLSSVVKQLQTNSNQYGTAIAITKDYFSCFIENNIDATADLTDILLSGGTVLADTNKGYNVVKIIPHTSGVIKNITFRKGTTNIIRIVDELDVTANTPVYLLAELSQASDRIFVNTTATIDISVYPVTEISLATVMKSVLASDLKDKSNTITYTNGEGKRLTYYSDVDIRISNAANNKTSDALLVKRGDVLIFTGSLNRTTIVGCDSNGENRYYIGNTKGLSYYRFVAPKDMYVRFTLPSNGTVAYYSIGAELDVFEGIFNNDNTFAAEKIEPILQNAAEREYIRTSAKTRNLVLLHFSDIHGRLLNMDRILGFKDKFKAKGSISGSDVSYVDDILSTGDVCPSKFYDYNQNFDTINGYNKVLQVIGNHDVYDANGDAPSDNYDSPEYWATPQQKYERYMQYASQWGITQPTGAGENDYYPCYYYKDYTDEKVRLIVLDAMAYDATQHTWFVNTLESARISNMHVVCADHFIPTQGAAEVAEQDYNGFNTPFNSLINDMASPYGRTRLSYLDGETRIYATDAVDTFITNNGNFVCWLAGHMHYDLAGKIVSHPNQMYIAVATANVIGVMRHDARSTNLSSIDCFNIVAIDTFSKQIKVLRIGAQWDRWLRKRETMLIDYENRTLQYTS